MVFSLAAGFVGESITMRKYTGALAAGRE